MSDNIPFDIQMQIIKKVYNVKSLIRFRSVSKPWKSFIDSSDFIKGYVARHTQPRSRILMYRADLATEAKHICFVDDDNNETFEVQQQEFAPFVMSQFLKHYRELNVVGACHGLVCLYGFHKGYNKEMVVIWNPSIQKSFGVAAPLNYSHLPPVYGFGVCPVTRDPTVVRITYIDTCYTQLWRVEVFTLSSGVWNVIPSGNLPCQSVTLNSSTQVAIDRFIYWGASEPTSRKNMVVSFDLITKDFNVVDLPNTLKNELFHPGSVSNVSVSKLRGSLVVFGPNYVEGAYCCDVWMMEHDLSFRKLFTIGTTIYKILGFRKNGEPIFEILKEERGFTTINVYDPFSQQIKNLGISGVEGSFFMGSYKESLLLLDHSDLYIHCDHN